MPPPAHNAYTQAILISEAFLDVVTHTMIVRINVIRTLTNGPPSSLSHFHLFIGSLLPLLVEGSS